MYWPESTKAVIVVALTTLVVVAFVVFAFHDLGAVIFWIGGLILSTLLTLVIVPAAFSLADDFERWLGSKFGKLLTHDHPGRPATAPAAPAE